MKSKLKYYAQVIGVNLLAFLVPVLAVVLIYGLGKLKNICSHPCGSVTGDIRLLSRGNYRSVGWFLRRSFAPWLGR